MAPRPRSLRTQLHEALAGAPVVLLCGPRGAGKTTFLHAELPDHRWLEVGWAGEASGLAALDGPVVVDEISPGRGLLEWGAAAADRGGRPGGLVLVSSRRIPRTGSLVLLPFSWSERQSREPLRPTELATPGRSRPVDVPWTHVAQKGFYPGIHYGGLDPWPWQRRHLDELVTRDLRLRVNVDEPLALERFLRECAHRVSQPLNLSAVSTACAITPTTARRWLELLEESFLLWRVPAHRESFGRRLVRSPKLYFVDTGLLCALLGIQRARELEVHPLRGAIFENLVAAELLKSRLHRGEPATLSHWRDSNGRRIDLLAGEVALAIQPDPEADHDLDLWRRLAGDAAPVAVIHGGGETTERKGILCRSWSTL